MALIKNKIVTFGEDLTKGITSRLFCRTKRGKTKHRLQVNFTAKSANARQFSIYIADNGSLNRQAFFLRQLHELATPNTLCIIQNHVIKKFPDQKKKKKTWMKSQPACVYRNKTHAVEKQISHLGSCLLVIHLYTPNLVRQTLTSRSYNTYLVTETRKPEAAERRCIKHSSALRGPGEWTRCN